MARRPPPPPRKGKTPAKLAALPTADYLRAQLEAALQDLDDAREDQSWQAVATLHRQANAMRADLDTATKPAGTGAETMDDAALLELLLSAVPDLPDASFDRLEAAVALRRTGRPSLRVVTTETG